VYSVFNIKTNYQMTIRQNIWLIFFVIWGFPLTYYRSKFRKLVYQTDSWLINIKPLFWKELRALFGNIYPENKDYIKFRNFYRLYLTVYTLLFMLYLSFNSNAQTNKTQAMKRIEVGSTIPAFSLKDQNGNQFDISSVIGQKKLVIYFYPKDDSPGCTKEACYFRDQFDVFNQADALVIGISGQSVESHKKFAEKYRLNYTLLSDEGNKVRKLFEVPTNFFGMLPGRVTYVIDLEGKVVYIFNSQVKVIEHVDEALRILKEIK
jgi:thioredoxin-dependent peroxiredoxin